MTLLTKGFHHVAMKVYDLDKSIAFYKAIGAEVKRAWGEGDSRAVMIEVGEDVYLELFAGGPNPPQAAGFVGHFAFRTDDAASALAAAVSAGAVVTVPLKEVTIPSKPEPLPVKLAFCTGPDGEVIEFFQPLV